MRTFIKENWSKILIVIIFVGLVSLISKFFVRQEIKQNKPSLVPAPATESGNQSTQIANPASKNCIEKGGKLSIVDKPEGQVGMCTLSNGAICEEWAFFRSECKE